MYFTMCKLSRSTVGSMKLRGIPCNNKIPLHPNRPASCVVANIFSTVNTSCRLIRGTLAKVSGLSPRQDPLRLAGYAQELDAPSGVIALMLVGGTQCDFVIDNIFPCHIACAFVKTARQKASQTTTKFRTSDSE